MERKTQAVYTLSKASQVTGLPEDFLLRYIETGYLKADYMHNIATYIIKQSDLVDFLRSQKKWTIIRNIISARVLIIDRDPHIRDILKIELGREKVDVKTVSTEYEVEMMLDQFLPDVLVISLGAITRAVDPVSNSIKRYKQQRHVYTILYHPHLMEAEADPEIKEAAGSIGADKCISVSHGTTALVDAIRIHLGLKQK